MDNETEDSMIIIEGLTKEGRKFRPSDWAERMSGALSTFGRDNRIHYSPMLLPITINGIKCVAVDPALQNSQPEMYHYIMSFVKSNQLKLANNKEEVTHDSNAA